MECDTAQHPFARIVGKPHIAEFDLPANGVKRFGVRLVHHIRLDVKDREDLLSRGECRLQTVELLGKVLNRREKLRQVHIEGDDRARAERLPEEADSVDISLAAEIEQAEHRGNIQHIDHRAEHAEYEGLLVLGTPELLVLLRKLAHLAVLTAEDLRDLHAGKVFGEIGIDVGGAVLDLTVRTT